MGRGNWLDTDGLCLCVHTNLLSIINALNLHTHRYITRHRYAQRQRRKTDTDTDTFKVKRHKKDTGIENDTINDPSTNTISRTHRETDTHRHRHRQRKTQTDKGTQTEKHMSHISEFNLLNVGTRTLSNQPIGECWKGKRQKRVNEHFSYTGQRAKTLKKSSSVYKSSIYESWASLSVQGPARWEC